MKTAHELDFCLLIPCHNNFSGLVESLKTVLYPVDKYSVVIVDDGSGVPLELEKIKNAVGGSLSAVLLVNEKNLGITKSLNKGLSWIGENLSTKYIARLDCGDLCTPDRFEIQVRYMDDYPDTGLIGSWCHFREKNTGKGFSYRTPCEHKAIVRGMHFRNLFIHPTVLFRASVLPEAGFYPAGYDYAEDYAFFWKLIKLKKSFVVNKFLVICALNAEGLSFKNRGKQLVARWKVVKDFSINPLYRVVAFLQLKILLILPKGLILQLKKMKG